MFEPKQYLGNMKIGYARVSTLDQDLGRQIDALNESGCDIIYQEKVSGMRRERPELNKLLQSIQSGDVLIVHKLDRLGRSLLHLIDIINQLKAKNVGFKSLSDSFDTTTTQGTLIFQIIGAMAEFERSLISDRIKHSLAFKKKSGIVLGRPKQNWDEKISVFKHLLDQGEDQQKIMLSMNLSRSKYYRFKKMSQKENNYNIDTNEPILDI